MTGICFSVFWRLGVQDQGAAELVPGEVSLSGSQATFPLRPHSHGLSAA